MIYIFAIIGAFVAFIPGASFVLIPIEMLLVYMIAKKHNAFEFVSFILIMGALGAISTTLKGLASVLHGLPIIGQIANSAVAFGFILVLGLLAEKFYASRSTA